MQDALLDAIVVNHGTRPRSDFWFSIVDEVEPLQQLVFIADIQRTVARHFGLTTRDLISDSRRKREILPRHIAMYLCRKLTRRSHAYIAQLFNRGDHSVSIYAHDKIAGLIERDSEIAEDVRKLTVALA